MDALAELHLATACITGILLIALLAPASAYLVFTRIHGKEISHEEHDGYQG